MLGIPVLKVLDGVSYLDESFPYERMCLYQRRAWISDDSGDPANVWKTTASACEGEYLKHSDTQVISYNKTYRIS